MSSLITVGAAASYRAHVDRLALSIVLSAVALVPSPPLLVPELTGRGVQEAAALRTAALAAASSLAKVADRWVAVGVAVSDGVVTADVRGSFAGYGVDVPVSLSPTATRFDAELALPALIAGWLRGKTAPRSEVEVVLVTADGTADDHARVGRDLRKRLDEDDRSWGLLVVGDGASTLTARAPGSFDDRAGEVQERIDNALAAADPIALAALDAGLCADVGVSGLAAWQTAVGVVAGDRVEPRTLYREAPFGVGYFVGTWTVVPGEAVSGEAVSGEAAGGANR